MPHHYQLVVHYNKIGSPYLFETEDKEEQKEYEDAAVPKFDRPSTEDAALFRQLQVVLTYKLLLGNKFSDADHEQIMLLCKYRSHAFNLYLPYRIKNAEQNYLDRYFSESAPTSTKKYFNQLGITKESKKTPTAHLMQNIVDSEKEKLLHVRQCEHPECSLNPSQSGFTARVNDNVGKQVVKYITKAYKDKTQTISYGGFASGNLSRDLYIIWALIKSGYKNFKFFFLDTGFEKLIQLTESPINLSLPDEVEVGTRHKAILDFSKWIAAHVNCDKEKPAEIHLFSDIQEAEHYFRSGKEKLTVLVGQDYWTKEGCDLPVSMQTPDAHADFMRLAQAGLANNGAGRFFELIKNDCDERIYFHIGDLTDGKYRPLGTNEIDRLKKTTTVYLYASLGLFSKDCKDDTLEPGDKKVWALLDEHGRPQDYSSELVLQYI